MLVSESPSRDLLRLLVWYPFRWLIRILPIRFSFCIFRWLGRIHLRLASNKPARIARNLVRAFPDERDTAVHSHVRDYFENHYIDRLHIFTYPALRKSRNIDRIIRLNGLEHLDQTLAKGRGAVIVLGHYGPIQLPLFALGKRGFPIIQIGLPTDEGRSWIGKHVAFKLRLQFESMIPARIVSADRFLRPVFKHLSNNGIVMMNLDPAGGGRWIGRMEPCELFGKLIPFSSGAISLSGKTAAPILPLTLTLDSSQHYVATIHPPVVSDTATSDHVLNSLVVQYRDHIRNRPGLWHFWDEFEPGKLILDASAAEKMRQST